MNTKDRILSAALELFNQKGSDSVTTNHIAKACGISPGNLYYHFKNKDAIIQELYIQMHTLIGFENRELPATLCELFEYCHYVANIWWEYRFFRQEIVRLTHKDPILNRLVIGDSQKQLAKLHDLLTHFEAQGLLAPLPPSLKEHLANAILLYSNFWTPYLMLIGKEVTKERSFEVIEEISALLDPFLTPRGKAQLKQC